MIALNEISPNAASTSASMKSRSEGITAALSGVPQLDEDSLECLCTAVGVPVDAPTCVCEVIASHRLGLASEVEFDQFNLGLATAALGKGKSPRKFAGASRRVWRFTCLLRTASLKAAIGADGVACRACVPTWTGIASL